MISSGIRSSSSRCSSSAYVFTASQWQELEQQLLTFKYIMSGVPVPPELISTVITTPLTCSSSSLFPPPLQQQSLPFGWGCFQVGYGRKIDPEPGRCRRTDGKKWRCTKEACPDSKYCERHMHRGKNKTKKPIQVFPNSTTTTSTTTPTTTPTNRSNTGTDQTTLVSPPSNSPSTTVKNHLKPAFFTSPATSCPVPASITTTTYPQYKSQKLQSSSSFYPFLSHTDQSPSFSPDFTESTPHDSAPQWLLDPNSYVQPKKEIRYTNEMKGAVSERISAPFRDTGYDICKEEKEVVRFGFDDKDETQKQLFHHFLGD